MRLGCVLMASGHSTRFGGDKLLFPLNGKPLAAHAMDALPGALFECAAAVTRSPEVAALAEKRKMKAVMNPDRTDDPAVTIRLGLGALPPGLHGCLFLPCDQPGLRAESVERMAEAFRARPQMIVALGFKGRRGSPVIFPAALFLELSGLSPGAGGKQVLLRHPERLLLVEAGDELELMDIDTREDLGRFTRLWRGRGSGPGRCGSPCR